MLSVTLDIFCLPKYFKVGCEHYVDLSASLTVSCSKQLRYVYGRCVILLITLYVSHEVLQILDCTTVPLHLCIDKLQC